MEHIQLGTREKNKKKENNRKRYSLKIIKKVNEISLACDIG